MKKFSFKPLSALALAAPLVGCEVKEERPNIVLFLIDDLGWLDTSVAFGEEVYPFNMRHDTPNIAALADKGAIMTSAYVCPVSTPTRTSIMSGMNAAHTRITNYTSVNKDWNPDATDTPSAQEKDVINRTDWNINGVTPSAEPLDRAVHITPYPQILKDEGYYTIHVGNAIGLQMALRRQILSIWASVSTWQVRWQVSLVATTARRTMAIRLISGTTFRCRICQSIMAQILI